MINTLLSRLNSPGSYAVSKALKEIRGLIHCYLTGGMPDRHRIKKAKTRLADILQNARDKHLRPAHIRLIVDTQQVLLLVEDSFREIRDYNLEHTQEITKFFTVYIAILDAFRKTIAFPVSGTTTASPGSLITAGRELVRSFRLDILSRNDNFPDRMALLTLYSHLETVLSESNQEVFRKLLYHTQKHAVGRRKHFCVSCT